MLAIIEAVAMPQDENGKQLIQLYSYQREDGGGDARTRSRSGGGADMRRDGRNDWAWSNLQGIGYKL